MSIPFLCSDPRATTPSRIHGAPPPQDLYPPVSPSKKSSKASKKYGKTQASPSPSTPTMSPATAAYGNTKPMSPTDMEFRIDSPVAADRPNGPMVTSLLRRDSLHIPVDSKMPGTE